MGIRVKLLNVRLAFAHQLFTASAVEEGKTPKYGCDSLLVSGSSVAKLVPDGTTPEGKPKFKAVPTTMEAVLLEVANDTMKGKGKAWLDALENSKKCYRNGDLRVNKNGDHYEGYEGVWYVSAKSVTRPLILDSNKHPLTIQDGKPYSGCYGHVSVDVYGIADPKKKGVHASIKGVQFVRDGDAFGGGAPASPDEFDEISEGADAAADLV